MKLIVLKNNVPLSDVSIDTSDPAELYEIYVGRAEDCHVQIDDPLISRHHFVLKREQRSWFCEKLSQLGLITLHGSIVTKSPVKNGDEIKCGVYSIFVSDLIDMSQASPVVVASSNPDYPNEEELVDDLPVQVTPLTETAKLDSVPDSEPDPSLEEIGADIENEEPVFEEGLSELAPVADGGQDELDQTAVFTKDEAEEQLKNLDSFDETGAKPESNDLDFLDSGNADSAVGDLNGGELATSTEFSNEGGDSFAVTASDSVEDSAESTKVFKAFVNYQLVLFGEHAPYDRFQIDQDEIFIGRDPKKCQILLNDPEVSSVHAVLKKNNAEVTLEDLNSSNGTILNGERINKAQITTGDEFVIGSTSFTLEVRSDLLESESERLMPVESGQVVETEEVIEEEVSGDGELGLAADAPPEKSIIKRIMKDPQARRKAIWVAAGLIFLFVFLSPDEEVVEKPNTPEVSKDAKKDPKAQQKVLSKELENARNVAYELGVSYFDQSRFDLAQVEFQKVVSIDPNYKKVQSYLEQTNLGLKRLEEIEAEERAKAELIKTKKFIEELLVKAREAVKNRQVQLAESFFTQIAEKDPENIEVSQLRIELESWQKEEERKALEKAVKEAARKKMVDALLPGKTFYLKKQWYLAINKLEDFLRIKNMDEDLIKEASEMLSDSKNQLASEIGPLLGKARSLKEGQDLKAAYEAYLDVQKVEPTNKEALDEIDDIKSNLDARSKRIYREAIIAESLSLFGDAKEKFQEVQQISPTDSEYYKKATEKLRNYLE